MPRWAAKTDDNHQEIMDAFRDLGCSVSDTSRLGQGFPDCAVGKFGITVLCEIKDGAKSPSKRALTPDEEKWHKDWNGWSEVVESIDDVIDLVERMRVYATDI